MSSGESVGCYAQWVSSQSELSASGRLWTVGFSRAGQKVAGNDSDADVAACLIPIKQSGRCQTGSQEHYTDGMALDAA